jgi:hypothetical protein
MSVEWKNNINPEAFSDKYKEANTKAKIKLAYLILSDILNIAPRPPILTSALWGSGSVFVGNKFIMTSKSLYSRGSSFKGKKKISNPNLELSEIDDNKITVGFNMAYATRMHEHTGNWGAGSIQAGGVGNKFITRHIEGNAANYTVEYAKFVKKEMGM